jgi:ribosomal subunit interface protein
MEIIFKGRQTDVPARFRDYATAKLNKLEKLDAKALRVDVELSVERNPRQASQKERVELTIRSRGPAIRAEAAAEDRIAALDLALAKLDSRLRRALDRRKSHHHAPDRLAEQRESEALLPSEGLAMPAQFPAQAASNGPAAATRTVTSSLPSMPSSGPQAVLSGPQPGSPDDEEVTDADAVVPIAMEGDGPLVVRQKFHRAAPISIDQALLEMELVGHDFYLFHDIDEDMPSVVYRRRGYQYGVIRLVDNSVVHYPGQGVTADHLTAAGRGFATD